MIDIIHYATVCNLVATNNPLDINGMRDEMYERETVAHGNEKRKSGRRTERGRQANKERWSKRKYLIDMKFWARTYMCVVVCLLGQNPYSTGSVRGKLGTSSFHPHHIVCISTVQVCMRVFSQFFFVALRPSIM